MHRCVHLASPAPPIAPVTPPKSLPGQTHFSKSNSSFTDIAMHMKIEITVERTKTGYSAYAAKYPVYTVGKSLEELKSNILEAINLYLDRKGESIREDDLKIDESPP
jgi:predicted RNase H-like HicB family nuclease